MNKQEIIRSISENIYPFSDSCQQELYSRSTLKTLTKKEQIVKEGQRSDKVFYVANGATRAYYIKGKNDVTDWFAFENDFICPLQSFFENIPSPTYIESLDSSLVLEISRFDIMYLSDKYREFERLVNLITTQTMLRLQKRIVALQFETAQQKYANLLDEKSDIELRVPLIHIASYLGITIETLSRIRAKKAKI